ncbi:MAG: sodium:solute symporter family protein [Cyclobacteriaceae bacterium]
MLGLHIADVIVIILYLIGITIIGIRSARLVKNLGDFFMPRKFGKTMLIMHTFGTGTHSDQAVTVASKTYTTGLSGIWYQWLWLFATPFYWLIAPVMRRFRAVTTADVFEARFSKSVSMLYAVTGILQLMVTIGLMLKGSGAVVASAFDGTVSTNLAISVMTVLFVVYGIAGGLNAAIITDFIQGILTIIFSFLLLPVVMNAVGGMAGLRAVIADPHMFSLVAPSEIGFFYITIIALNGLIGIVTQPHTMGNTAAGRTEMDGRVGFTVGSFLKRSCTIAWTLTGFGAIAYYAGQDVDPDQVFGLIAKDFLPGIMPGMLGIFLASLLASVMSSCDSFMIASSALFTENIYKPLQAGRKQNHYIMVGRIASLCIVAGGVIFAFWLPGVVKGLEIFWKISPMMGIAFWLGLFWRRTTVKGAWAATLAGFFVWWLTEQSFFLSTLASLPLADSLLVADGSGGVSMYLPWQMVFYLSAGGIMGILVSLLTQPLGDQQLDKFYELVRTPVNVEEDNPEKPCTLPENIVVPPKDKMFPRSKNLEILMPDKISIIGFLCSWGAVVLLIAVFFIIT